MQIQTVVIFTPAYNQIMQVLKENPTIESVGLSFGIHEEDKIIIENFVSVKNLDDSPFSFSLDYEVLYKEIQYHEEKGEVLVGIFHSHPDGARLYPSLKDLNFMRYWPYPYLWLIGNIGNEEQDPKLAIFALLDEKIIEIPYLIVNTT
ncbi:MAG: Mov34/MPN/PAD-1 family protein [Candidatus Heimdallarchaeota archaeon]|nr:MAG: Mov34/MPN/PAD-1 family protein [Candidatus Heimdallarchaeota archaeon]